MQPEPGQADLGQSVTPGLIVMPDDFFSVLSGVRYLGTFLDDPVAVPPPVLQTLTN